MHFRDETTTVNRQPEFTQLDIELSFTNPECIMNLIENVLLHSWPCESQHFPVPFKKMTFDEAMDKYGSDKPDTRFNDLLVRNNFLFTILNIVNIDGKLYFHFIIQFSSVGKHHRSH